MDKYYLIIPDVHGRAFWKESVDQFGKDADRVIFLGDYIDPYPQEFITPETAIEEFGKIIEYKKSNPEKITLLLGNHDCHYRYPGEFDVSSRYNYEKHEEIEKLYEENKNLFQFSLLLGDILFTHAGIHPSWLEFNKLVPPENNLEQWINSLDNKYYNQVGRSRGGYYPTGSPIWADLGEYYFYRKEPILPGVRKQIIGHTMSLMNRGSDYDINEIVCLDCIGGYFLLHPEKDKLVEIPSKYTENYERWKKEMRRYL